MGDRVYMVPILTTAIGTAVQDICAIIPGTTKGIVLHHIHLDANVSAEAALLIRLKRATATVTTGSGGSAGVPTPVDQLDAAVTASVRLNDTAQATTSGGFVNLAEFYWDTALPFDHMPAPEDRERCSISSALILDLPAVIVSTTIAGYVKFAEVP